MKNPFLKGNLSPGCALGSVEYKRNFKAAHPEYFDPDGLLIFTGVQGSGKTLSAVQYCRKVIERYPDCIFCTNVDIKDLPPCKEVIPYDGLNCLMNLENGYAGVLYLIDEIHLEFNSLESKNISIEEMTEFAQQRKQRSISWARPSSSCGWRSRSGSRSSALCFVNASGGSCRSTRRLPAPRRRRRRNAWRRIFWARITSGILLSCMAVMIPTPK